MVYVEMPNINGSEKADKLSSEMQKIALSEGVNGPKLHNLTNDGSSNSASQSNGYGASGDQSPDNNSRVPDNAWSNDLTEGVEPDPGDEEDDDSTDESSEEDSSSEDEEIKAPVELIGEFLVYVRTSDWENAAKLCKMILIYEPDNAVALQFQPVIVEKAQIEKELAEMSSSSEEEDSSDEDDSEEENEYDNPDNEEDPQDDSSDEFEPRPGSRMKNNLVFPHLDPVWRP